ncbi:hypothetical protein ACVWWJ_001359 [Luteibacter sp. HA06]|jgi:hypothetical protein
MKRREKSLRSANDARVSLRWPRACFDAEARADARETPSPPALRSTLKAGDRVSFDLGEGVDGPMYATHVRPIEPK